MKTETRILDSEPIIEEQGINVELLAQVADYVERHPQEFGMDYWLVSSEAWWKQAWLRLTTCLDLETTVGCVACHTVRLGGEIPVNTPAQAQRLLRISDEQALRLFYWFKWPQPYRREYETCGAGSEARAWIAAQRFRHFIETSGTS